ncbi:hypothetical protein HDU85_006988 [Gaertneriomyces sp. JEL0708]|nr:hypothetical protein HDU85_006988 [Gaertneriomyces sp. JEL0708]
MIYSDPTLRIYTAQILSSLRHHNCHDALFLADRLVSLYPDTILARYLQAKCYYCSGRPHIVYRILQDLSCDESPQAAFLLAKSAFDIGELGDAERALRGLVTYLANNDTVTDESDLPKLAEVLSLLGIILQQAGKVTEAVDAYRKALQLDSLLWSAYQGLCELGEAPQPDEVFQPTPALEDIIQSQTSTKSKVEPPNTRSKKRLRSTTGKGTTENGTLSHDALIESAEGILQDLQSFGAAVRALYKYETDAALQAVAEMDELHIRSSFALILTARAYYEVAKYPEAARYFQEVRDLEPWRVEGLDLYGSCLWHMKKEMELACLAKEMEANDRLAPQTWCVVGNLYSLRQEHELAVKCFSRAIQLDPTYAYAYTLIGFEYKMKEDLEKAISYFQKSVRICPRPFNAWFGLGEVYYQQENYKMSRFHYEKAVSINGNNPIVHFHLGTILQKFAAPDSLDHFKKAVELDPKSSLYRFRLAYALASQGDCEAALEHLAELETATQIESNVYLLMGRCLMSLGKKREALMAYTKARDWRGGRCDLINEAVESVYSENDIGGISTEQQSLLPSATVAIEPSYAAKVLYWHSELCIYR